MSNMGYCRFRNTLVDILDCYDNLDTLPDLSMEERRAAWDLIEICRSITDECDHLTREQVLKGEQ